MRPIEFSGQNTVIAKEQPEYLGLPAHLTEDGLVISCWRLSIWERLKVLWNGHIWLEVLTFNNPLQPLFMSVDGPFREEAKDD